MLSSLASWIGSGASQPSLIDGSSCPEFSWFAYHVLRAETEHEVDTQLWKKIQKELLDNPSVPVEQLLKVRIPEEFDTVICCDCFPLTANVVVLTVCLYRLCRNQQRR